MAFAVAAQVFSRSPPDRRIGGHANERVKKSFQFWVFGQPGPGPEFCRRYGREKDERVGFAQFHPLCKNRGITASGDFDENVGIDEDRHRSLNLSSREPRRRRLTSSVLSALAAWDLRIPTNCCIGAL